MSRKVTARKDIESAGIVNIMTRTKPCGCGCHGADSWHRPTIARKVRSIRVHAAPVRLNEYTWEIARATVKMPWGSEEVRAILMYEAGMYATWELVNRK